MGELYLSGPPEKYSEMGAKAWAFAQKIIGPLVVAALIWLVDDRNSAWDLLDSNQHDIESIKKDILVHELRVNREIGILQNRNDELREGLRECQRIQQDMAVSFGKLPPDTWKTRIRENEKAIESLKAKVGNSK